MNIKSKNNNSVAGVIFDGFNYVFLALYGLASIVPFIYILAASFSTDAEIAARPFYIFPHKITTEAYSLVINSAVLYRSLGVSVYVTLMGTLISLFCTITFAYTLSKKNLIGRGLMLNCVVFTMMFSGGMIPHYLMVKNLHLIDTYWALMLPGAIHTMNLIIIKNFFQSLPAELMEASMIDGCTEMETLWKIVLPLSKPIIATFGLFYAVGYWNEWFGALLYMNNPKKWPLQVILRQIILLSQGTLAPSSAVTTADYVPPAASLKMATIIVGVVPIMMIYPFLQKYFAKGVMMGAVKG